jgi:radical SAM-linked protein
VTEPRDRYRYAIDFSIEGDIRFVSHNDLVRMFGRACARAALPVAFTRGFNPHVRLSLPLPRPVGQASEAERLIVDLIEAIDEASLLNRLQSQVPDGLSLLRATRIESSRACQAVWVRYRIATQGQDREKTVQAAESLLGSSSFIISRVRHRDGKVRQVDIRPFIDTIDLLKDAVDVSVHLGQTGSATPSEVAGALGMEADRINHLIRRMEIKWQNSQPVTQTPTPQ